MVSRVDHTFSALSLLGIVLRGDHESLVIAEEKHVTPLFQKRRRLLRELHFPAVISAHFVGLLKLSHLSVSGDHDVYASGNAEIQGGEQPGELLGHIGVALAVAKTLYGVLLVLVAEIGGDQLLCPVGSVDDQGLADPGRGGDFFHDGEQLLPGLGLVDTADIHVRRAALGVDNDGIREPGGKARLSDSFRPVDDYLLGTIDFSFGNVQHVFSPYLSEYERSSTSAQPGTFVPAESSFLTSAFATSGARTRKHPVSFLRFSQLTALAASNTST